MRVFDFKSEYAKLLTPEIVSYLSQIHEYKGRQVSLVDTKQEILDDLVEIAKIQSTEASNRIEGIATTEDRLKMLVRQKTMPKTRSEKEIAGYRDVLSTIHENYKYIFPRPNYFLQMHRDLYKFSGRAIGGNYKNTDNIIAREQADDTQQIRFIPMSAWETPDAVSHLCDAWNEAVGAMEMDPLLLIPVFILDFLCIHPFNDGNGRMSRLITLLLLYRADYFIGRYISLEKLIFDTKETYYEALQASSHGWQDGANDYAPFAVYLLGIILAAYRDFDRRVELLSFKGTSKPDRVRAIIKNHLGKITKAEIMAQCPGISQVTVQRALAELLKKEEIQKIGGGRYTSYVWNGEK